MRALDFFQTHAVKVFPLHGKKPAVPKGTHWADWDDFVRPRPKGAYGVVLGALIVVDTDTPDAEHWAQRHVPTTPFVVETKRGRHRYLKAPATPTPPFIRRDGLTIESRRAGEYVVGPGSLHEDGVTRYVASEWSWRWDDLPTFPADFDFGVPASMSVGGAPYVLPTVIDEGCRHYELFRLVRSLKALGKTRTEARVIVENFNRNVCTEPIDLDRGGWFGRAWRQPNRQGFDSTLIDLPIVQDETANLPVVPDETDDLPVLRQEDL